MIEIGKKGVLIQSQGGIDINSRDNKTEYEMKFGQVNQDAIPSRPYVPQYVQLGPTATWKEPVLSDSLLPTTGNSLNDVRVAENGGLPSIYICIATSGSVTDQWREYNPAGVSSHNNLLGLQGGVAGQYYHLSSSDYADNATKTWTTSLVNSVSGGLVNYIDIRDAYTYGESVKYTNTLVEAVSSQVNEHNELSGIQGGQINQYYHLNQSDYVDRANKTWVWALTDTASGESYDQAVAYTNVVSGTLSLYVDVRDQDIYNNSVNYTNSLVEAVSSQVNEHNELGGIQGGQLNEYYHLNQGDYNDRASKTWVSSLTTEASGNAYNQSVDYATSLVASVSGAENHNDLKNIQGGQSGQYFHFNQSDYNDRASKTWVSTLVDAATGGFTTDHNALTNIQGGAVDEYYHLNSSDYADRITKTEATSLSQSASANAYDQSVLYTNALVEATSGVPASYVQAASANAYNQSVLYTNSLVEATSGYIDTTYVESASSNAYNRAVSYTNSATANLEHNNLQSIQGGDVSNRYHLTQLEYDQVRSVATAAVTGMLSPSDYTTFNNKQDALAFTAETENKFLRDDNTFQPIETAVGGYANNLYFSDTESDIATYNTLTYTAPSGQATHTHTVNSSEGNKLLHAYIYPSAVSVDIFPSGIWSFKFYGNVSSTAGVTQIGVEYFARHQDTSETTLFTDWSDEINNTTDNWFVFPTYTHPAYSINVTDRMGARVYVRTTHNSDITISYYIGDGYGAYLNNPNKIRHSQLRGLNDDSSYLHVSSAEKATWNGKADVSYVESASANAYNSGVTYTNSVSSWAYNSGITYTNSATAEALIEAKLYTDSVVASVSGAENHNDLKNIQGGDVTNRYHLSNPEYNQVRQTATASVTGMLSPADWYNFNSKTSIAQVQAATGVSYANGVTYSNSASANAYNQAVTYSNSASANAYSLANTYSDQKWVDINRYGFVNPYSTISIGFNDATNVFTLTDKGSGWAYYRAGVRHAISGNKTVTVPVTAGDNVNYFIYIDSTDGSLTSGTSSWTLNDTKVPVAVIHYDSAYTPKYLMSYECHSCAIDRAYHREHHFAEGSEYVSGGIPADYVLSSTNDADKVFGISAATMADEDLFLVQSALTKPNGSTAVYPILYRVSTTRYSWYLSDMPFRYGGTPPSSYTYIEYDAAGSSTPTVNNRWVNTYLFLNNVQANDEATQGTSTSAYRFFIVQGRGQFTSLALAQGESFSSFGLAGFPVAEGVALYQLTWNTSGVANSVKGRCTLAAVTRINSNIVTTSAVVSTNHNTLTGLQGGQSGEYYHLTADQQALAISTASAAATGLLMSDDWNIFNNKAGTASPVFTGTVQVSAVKMATGASSGYVFTSDAVGVGRWAAPATNGTVTSVAAGNGMNFSTITGTGSVTLGTPGALSASSTDAVTTNSHTHSIDATIARVANPVFTGTVQVSAIKMATGASSGYVFTSDAVGVGRWAAPATNGTVTSVAAGNGMNFSSITGTGSVTLGTPGALSATSTDAVTTNSHTHSVDATIARVANPIFTGTVQASAIKMSAGASDGYVYTSDSVGVGRWAAPAPDATKLPLAGGTMTGDIVLGENTSLELDPAMSADEKWSGITVDGTSGVTTLAVGDLCYLDATAGEWLLADADSATTAGPVILGMCILAGADGQPTKMLLSGTIRSAAFPSSLTLGAPVYVSTTAGDITATAPSTATQIVRIVGWSVTTEPNTIYFAPDTTWIEV